MKYSFHLPEGDHPGGEFTGRKAIDAMVQSLERAGIDACYVTDHPAPSEKWLTSGGHHTLDPFVALSFAACAGERIKLHTNAIVLPYRNPLLIAKQVATLDTLSNGRLILGVAAGYMQEEFAALGAPMANRGVRVSETLVVMKMAWTGQPIHYTGRDFKADGNVVLPPPIQKPHPPIWMGGNSESAIRRAAEHCDGWLPLQSKKDRSVVNRTRELVTIEDLEHSIAQIKLLRGELGKTGPFDIAMVLRSSEPLEKTAMIGQLRQLEQAGVTWAVLTLAAASCKQYMDKVAWFAQEVKSAV